MRLIRFQSDSQPPRYGLELEGNLVRPLSDDPFRGDVTRERLEELAGDPTDLPESARLAPIEPRNIFCIGLNYREHARETGASIPEHPVVFMKPTTAVADPGRPVAIPACCTHGPEVDYECELAVVIGKRGKDIPEADALGHVLGYTCANDVSARRWQKHSGGGQWVRGKSFDGFCPLGPAIVTTDVIPDPQELAVSTDLSGAIMQRHNTGDMIFTIKQLIAFLSQDTTLLPGTVILTGTPQGVGVARDPKVFVKPGDTVTVEIERIGQLVSPIVDAK